MNRSPLRLDRAIRLVWSYARGWTLANLALVVAQGALPLAALYLTKRIIDAVTVALAAADRAAAFGQVVPWLVLATGVALLTALSRSLAEWTAEAQSNVITDAVADILHSQSIAVDLGYYEDARYFDTLHRAQQEAPYRPAHVLNGLVSIGQSALVLVGIAGLLIALDWRLAAILFGAALPAGIVRVIHARRLFSFEQQQTRREREAWYYHWMLTEPSHAKELRLFALGDLFRGRFRTLRRDLRAGRLSLAGRRARADFLVQALASLAVYGTFAFTSYQAILGAITLGDLVMYYQGFQTGLGALQGVLRGLAGLYEDNLFLGFFYDFLDLQPAVRAPAAPRSLPPAARAPASPRSLPPAAPAAPISPSPATPAPTAPGSLLTVGQRRVVFENVDFSYPGGRPALAGIDLELRPGEVIALVGANGSGKTTLVKLLCRLYDPGAGRITVDGVDLRDLDPVAWRGEISVIFQDYLHYQLSARENIWLGNIALAPDDPAVEAAARRSGADEVIRGLPRGYDTRLGNWFEQGRELSIGEWQKVALARAFLRDAGIVVLDEPTSALDPLAEAEVFRRFRSLTAGRSAILISHRFSTVQAADCIYVLDGGRIVERGSHADLLAAGRLYARLYHAQADRYAA